MPLSLDVLNLAVPDVTAAHAFYSAAFTPTATQHKEYVRLDLSGAGQVNLQAAESLATDTHDDASTSGFRGCVMNYIVSQPSEVEALLTAAVQHGAKILRPARKGFFGGFTAVLQAADGTIWKLAAPTKKDTGPAGDPPTPTEIVVILGVAAPKAAKTFYETLGMTVDRDYGDKFIDFRFDAGTCRLGLMPRKELAKDAGVDPEGGGFRAVALTHQAKSRDEVDDVLAAAASAGGQTPVPAQDTGGGGYTGYFADPDGHLWRVTTT